MRISVAIFAVKVRVTERGRFIQPRLPLAAHCAMQALMWQTGKNRS